MENKNKKIIAIAGVALVVLIALFAIFYNVFGAKSVAGSKNIVVEVVSQSGDATTYSLGTDAEFLRQAMDELAAGNEGFSYSGQDSEYGIMVEEINGEKAVYAENQAYWSLYVNGEYGNYGADQQPVADGDTYTWKYESESN